MTYRLSLPKSFGYSTFVFIALCIAAVFALTAGVAQAQLSTATINGTVSDPSGAVIPGATVTVKNAGTNVERSTTTNSAGNYTIVNINPGRYTLTVHKDGFTTLAEPEFELAVNQTTTMDFALHVGSAVENVTVEAVGAGLETSTSELGTVIDRRAVNDLPLNGRNFTQLLDLTPGVSTVNVAQNASNQQFQGNPVGSFSFPSINGQTNRSNLFLLDGINNQESFNSTYSVPPIIDDIREFKVDSHNDQAQFGGVLGGVVNVVTKSGTNQFHGEAWEFFRNDALDAVDPFTPISASTGKPLKNMLRQNEFGANIGGPVLLPHYNGRNKTFFFGSFEQAIIHTGNNNTSLVPTPAWLTGDFTFDQTGKALPQIFNPYSTAAGNARAPFRCVNGAPAPLLPGTKLQDQTVGAACNILPSSLIDPNMQNVVKLLYGGITPNITPTSTQNYAQTLLNTLDPLSYSFRIDEQLGEKNAVFGRFSHNDSPRNVPGIFGQVNDNDYTAHQVAINWNHVFGPSAVLSVQFGRNYGYSTNNTLLSDATSQKLLQAGGYNQSFACAFVSGPRNCYFNGVNFVSSNPNIAAFQEGASPAVVADIYQGKGDFTKTHGRHTFQMGADFNKNGFQQTFNSGHLDFSASETSNKGTGGNQLASLLLGVPDGVTLRNEFETEYGGWVDGFYFQDQWRITDRLTMNLGARYDVTFLPIYGSFKDGNAPTGNFDANTGNYVLSFAPPTCAQTGNQLPPCIPGPLPAHVTVSPDGHFFHNNYDNIQPRVGLAFRLTNKTALRASYGRFFDNWAAILQMSQNQQGGWPILGQVSLGAASLNQNAPPTAFAENPFQTTSSAALPTPFGTVYDSNWYVDPNLKNPYSDQWNFGVQQALTDNTTLTVNYVGSNGHRLDVGITANQATSLGPGPVPSPSCYTTTCTPALVAASGRFPFPYQVPSHYDVSRGISWYDGLQASLEKKGSHGLSYLLAYTWSKAIDIGADEWFGTGTNGTSVQNSYNLNADKGLAGFDLPQIFVASVVYELPFGTGKRFETGVTPIDYVVGGWQVNTIANFNSGTLYNVTVANATGQNAGSVGTERVNLVGNAGSGSCPNGFPVGTLNCWFNTAAFQAPAQFTYGNFGRNVLRGDGRSNFDVSVFRSFPITEATRAEFRAEAFNISNSPVFGTPNANISSSGTFGRVTGTAPGYKPRQLQFALKLYF